MSLKCDIVRYQIKIPFRKAVQLQNAAIRGTCRLSNTICKVNVTKTQGCVSDVRAEKASLLLGKAARRPALQKLILPQCHLSCAGWGGTAGLIFWFKFYFSHTFNCCVREDPHPLTWVAFNPWFYTTVQLQYCISLRNTFLIERACENILYYIAISSTNNSTVLQGLNKSSDQVHLLNDP